MEHEFSKIEATAPIPSGQINNEMWKAMPKILEKIVSVVGEHGGTIEPTAINAVMLHLYAFILKNPQSDAEAIDKEFKKINQLSAIEHKAMDPKNPLPTIGFEIEFPDVLSLWQKEILNQLEIDRVAFEAPEWGFPQFEIHPKFSYSADVQTHILQDLINLEIIPQQDNPEIPPSADYPYSLHLNFGFPDRYFKRKKGVFPVEHKKVRDIITFGFTSKKRLETRKSKESMRISRAEESNKNTDIPDTSLIHRSEIMSLEFKNKNSFRLIKESQLLMALANISIKSRSPKLKQDGGLSSRETALLGIWKSFEAASDVLCKKYGITENMLNSEAGSVKRLSFELAENPQVKFEFRNLISIYARQTEKCLGEN